jgi:hypothetical protein
MTYTYCLHFIRKFAYFIHILIRISRRMYLKVMKFTDVIQVTITGFKLHMFSLKLVLLCQNMSE